MAKMSAAQRAKLLQQAGLDPAQFSAVSMQSQLSPWEHPQRVDSSPMRLPPNGSRLVWPIDTLIGDSSTTVLPDAGGDNLPAPLLPVIPDSQTEQWITDPHHYAKVISGLFVPGIVNAANTLQPFLVSPPGRRNWLTLRNGNAIGGANIYVDFDKSANVNSPLFIVPGQTVLLDTVVPQNDVYAFSDAASTVGLAFSYSNIPT